MTEKLKAALEGLAHLDAELQWTAQEMASVGARQHQESGRRFSVKQCATAFCPSVANLVAERMGATLDAERLSAAEASTIGCDAMVRLDPKQALDFYARVDLAARFVVAAAKLRAVTPKHTPVIEHEYWPFGMEGGFCNPNKLNDRSDSGYD